MQVEGPAMSPLEDQNRPDDEKMSAEATCEEVQPEETPMMGTEAVPQDDGDEDDSEEEPPSDMPPYSGSNDDKELSTPEKGETTGFNDEKCDNAVGEEDTTDPGWDCFEQVAESVLSTDLLSETSASKPDPPSILDDSLRSIENLNDGEKETEENDAVPVIAEPAIAAVEAAKSSLESPSQEPLQAPAKAEAEVAKLLVNMGKTPNNGTESELLEGTKSPQGNQARIMDEDEGSIGAYEEKGRPTPSPGPSPVVSTSGNYVVGHQQKQQQQPQQQHLNPPEVLQPTLEPFLRGSSPDDMLVLPPVDENRLHVDPLPPQGFLSLQQQQFPGYLQHSMQQQHPLSRHHHAMQPPSQATMLLPQQTSTSTRRKIRLRLQEERSHPVHHVRQSILGHLRKRSQTMMFGSNSFLHVEDDDNNNGDTMVFDNVDRGSISVSWFVGTSSLELHEHVRRSVVRKLKLEKHVQLVDMRLLDESIDPPEEIVLSPYIPDGSEFLLQFSLNDNTTDGFTANNDGTMTPVSQYSSRAPDSPSAAPSPHHSKDLLSSLNPNQLALLKIPPETKMLKKKKARENATTTTAYDKSAKTNGLGEPIAPPVLHKGTEETSKKDLQHNDVEGSRTGSVSEGDDGSDNDDDTTMVMHSEDPIEARLRQITELLISDRQKRGSTRRQEKRQVIFVLANYFVLFISLIAISAEIQARAPRWLQSLEKHMKDVSDCSADKEALFECVTNGDFAGLVASVMFWLTRSVATRKFFLFGFETPGKLWTVVYESFVTALCWGISYLFIRRGMNPDTRSRFLQKYWKDAVYGSLAGFNAAFLKQVLKNLIPQEAVEAQMAELVAQRQLRFLSWLPSFE